MHRISFFHESNPHGWHLSYKLKWFANNFKSTKILKVVDPNLYDPDPGGKNGGKNARKLVALKSNFGSDPCFLTFGQSF